MTDTEHVATGFDEVIELASMFAPIGPWVQSAACGSAVDPARFDAPTAPNGVVSAKQLLAMAATAGEFCAGCPVRDECLRDATNNGLTGLRGGVLITGREDKGFHHRNLLAASSAAA